MQGNGEFDGTQVGTEVSTVSLHGLHNELAHLGSERVELLVGEIGEIGRTVDAVEIHPVVSCRWGPACALAPQQGSDQYPGSGPGTAVFEPPVASQANNERTHDEPWIRAAVGPTDAW